MEPFKNLLNVGLVRDAATHLSRHGADFDAKRFTSLATKGLDDLEMKARALHICTALEATMPADFAAACTLFEAAMAPPAKADGAGLRGWILWPVGEYVARHGQENPKRALQTLHALTQRFTAEFAIRPFIVRHPELVFETLASWTRDDSEHVRRLVSEGSRPRLPWGLQLKGLIADPTPTLPLLRALQDDSSEYVRRSVANHLNDIAKDHPHLVASWLEEHLPQAGAQRQALLRHASRTLVKKGDARILTLWGFGGAFRGEATLQLAPTTVKVGGEVVMTLQLKSTSKQAQTLAIDYAVHHVKANGETSPKVFKGWTVTLPPKGELILTKRHSMKPVTTRRYFAGVHRIVAQINGAAVAEAAFTLKVPHG